METVVSDILRARRQEPGGLKKTAALSLAVHAAVVLAILLVPVMWPATHAAPPVIMTISLGGTPGPKTGGMTPISGRNIQAAPLSAAAPKVEKIALPAPKAEPAMVLPDPKLKPKPAPKRTETSKDETGRAGARGAETQRGSTTVDTGVRGMGFGLSNTGGGGSGGKLDVENFCCPEYLNDMLDRIRANWNQQVQATGVTLMKFTILRNGQITRVELEQTSNVYALDAASQRALALTPKIAPLPSAFPDDHLTVHLTFEYQRK
jgi:outer membrane biosynthesis protein TonB